MFRKFVFKNYWSFCSVEFILLLLFSKFSITLLFVIYSSRSVFVQSQPCSLSSVILSNYIHYLYTMEIPFFVWKVICQGSLFFIIIYRISFKVHFQIQPHNFSLVTTVKLHVYTYVVWCPCAHVHIYVIICYICHLCWCIIDSWF